MNKTAYFNRLLNVGLRGVTLLSKFLLVFFLAGFLEPKDLGLYGLIVATIAYAIYPLGFDFYTFTTRELLKRDRVEWGGLIKDQGVLHLILYAVFLPVFLLIFFFGFLPWYLAFWFFVLLVLEHINQELMRLLIATSNQLTASSVLFLRSGAWALFIAMWMFIDPAVRSLEAVLAAWSVGGGVALILACYRLHRLDLTGWTNKVNWCWLMIGLKIAIPFLVATLAIRGVFTIDKYWFEVLQGLEILGAYILFMGIANALMSFLDAGVFSFSYPNLILAHNKKDSIEFRKGFKRLFWQTSIFIIAFSIASLLAIKPLLIVLDKPLYVEQLSLFPWVLAAMALYAIGMVPHYALYAQGKDKPIILSHFATVVVFLPTTWMFAKWIPDRAVLLGLITTFTFLLIWKTWAFYRLTPKNYRSVVAAETY